MKQKLLILANIIIICLLALSSCDTGTTDPPEPQPPTISLDSETDSYTVRVNEEIVITPTYENVSSASFSWTCDGITISTSASLSFTFDEVGDYYVALKVTNSDGYAYKEIKISVMESTLPIIQLVGADQTINIAQGVEFSLSPVVTNATDASYIWTLNNVEIANTQELTYTISELGSYTLRLTVTNQDGSNYLELALEVMTQDQLPFSWSFSSTEYNLSSGRSIRLKCWNIENDFGGDYLWCINDNQVQQATVSEYIFDQTTLGSYTVRVDKYNTSGTMVLSQELTVNVCGVEGTYKRSTSGSANANVVHEFIPGPGQYVNEDYSCSTMAEANAYALSRLDDQKYVSLGAYGGYIVVGFDHSIQNSGGYDIVIKGNALETSSEPGIVMVMQDENGDGLPNDTWYELSGSETVLNSQIKDYAITYYKPSSSRAPVMWTDNIGGSGTIVCNTYHQQNYYYPEWIEQEQMTFYGTALVSKTYSSSDSYWVNPAFGWGYADNFSDTDTQIGGDTDTSNNYLKISNAIDHNGQSINLDYIDFVKVYTGVNEQADLLGEISTEVCSISDYNMIK